MIKSRAMIKNRQSGFSLIELMIALLLGIVLTGGIISVFLEGRRNFTQDERISRVQENGSFALRLLARELTMNGFMGGVIDLSKIVTVTPGTPPSCQDWLLTPSPIFEIYNQADGNEDAAFACLPTDAAVNTDLVAVKRASDTPLVKIGAWEPGFNSFVGTQYYLRAENGGLGDVEIDTGVAMTADVGSIVNGSSRTDVWEYYARLFYVGEENGYPSLCMRSLQAATGATQRCLVNGVEDVQIQLGLDTDGNGSVDTFESDSTVDLGGTVELDQVLMYRIFVLARSLEEDTSFTAMSRTYQLGDHNYVTPVDRYYRRVFETTVQRNNQVFTAFK